MPPFLSSQNDHASRVSVSQTSSSYASLETETIVQTLDRLNLPPDFIRPGDKVVLKPNWVKEHDERFPGPDQWEHVVTHPAVIAAVVDWAALRLQGQGSIVICDAPQTDSSFDTLRKYCGLDALVTDCGKRWPGVDIALLDLRPEEWLAVDGVTVSKRELPGDPLGHTHVRLNEHSEFVGFQGLGHLYGASYNMDETNERHQDIRHEYMLCRTPMDADVFINLPKLKCHKKVGLTCSLKNLVGINANKNWLPHHTEGTPSEGGDQFPANTAKAKLEHRIMGGIKRVLFGRNALSRCFVPLKKLGRMVFGDTQAVVRSGNWHGNDTCWRMVADLNKCFFYYDGEGNPRQKPMRYLTVVDGIIGGEGNGPMAPDPKPCGLLIAGTNPLAVDTVCCALMGFDADKVRMIKGIFAIQNLPIADFTREDILVRSNDPRFDKKLTDFSPDDSFRFKPHFGWVGGIE